MRNFLLMLAALGVASGCADHAAQKLQENERRFEEVEALRAELELARAAFGLETFTLKEQARVLANSDMKVQHLLKQYDVHASVVREAFNQVGEQVRKRSASCDELLEIEPLVEKSVNAGVAIVVELEQSIAASRAEIRKVAELVVDEDGRREFEESEANYQAAWKSGLTGMKKVLTDSYSDFVIYVVPQVCPPEKVKRFTFESEDRKITAEEADKELSALSAREAELIKALRTATGADRTALETQLAKYRADRARTVGKLQPGDVITVDGEGATSVLTNDNAAKHLPHYSKETVDAFRGFATRSNGIMGLSRTPENLTKIVNFVMDHALANVSSTKALDLALVIDTTSSMSDDIEAVKKNLADVVDRLQTLQASGRRIRVGIVLYRDQGDAYVSQVELNLTSDLKKAAETIQSLSIAGGGDEPEAVLDAVLTANRELSWDGSASRKMILIGDAPPQPMTADGKHDSKGVMEATQRSGTEVVVYPIVTNR